MSAIEAAGGEVWHQPVISINALSSSDHERLQSCKQRIMDLDLYQQVIFISTNAVKFGVDWIEQYWPQLPVGLEWHAIGAATAEAMTQTGLSVTEQGSVAMNSEELLASASLQSIDGQKILVIRGVGGREHLAEQIQARGAIVDYVECYQRVVPELPEGELSALLSAHQINVISVNSGESLDNFCALLGQEKLSAYLSVAVLVPGERVAAVAREHGFTSVFIADNAGHAATLRALESLQKSRQ